MLKSAKLLPLEGKYYGTRVELTSEDGFDSWIMIWHTDSSGPSRRELEDCVDPEEYEICDSHYETVTALEVAELLVGTINRIRDQKEKWEENN